MSPHYLVKIAQILHGFGLLIIKKLLFIAVYRLSVTRTDIEVFRRNWTKPVFEISELQQQYNW